MCHLGGSGSGAKSQMPLPTMLHSRGLVDTRRFIAWLLDSGVLLAYFITVIGIGLYKGRGDKTMEGFAVGESKHPVAGSVGVDPCSGDQRRDVPRRSRRGARTFANDVPPGAMN